MKPVEGLLYAAGLAVVAYWSWRGYLHPEAFRASPARRLGFDGGHFVAFLLLFLLGPLVAVTLANLWLPPPDPAAPDAPRHYAWRLLAMQLGALPLLAYLGFRLARTPLGFHQFGLLSHRPWRDVMLGLAALAGALPVLFVVGELSQWFSALFADPPDRIAHEMLRLMMETREPWVLAVMVLVAVVSTPILEEIIFRGLVQTALLRAVGEQRRWTALLIAAGVFAVLHLSAAAWQTLPTLFCLALILGWLYERTGSLWPGIVVHAGFNAIMIAAARMHEASP